MGNVFATFTCSQRLCSQLGGARKAEREKIDGGVRITIFYNHLHVLGVDNRRILTPDFLYGQN